ncbi:peptidase S8 [Novosphingobium sediminis]|uniref:Peptidase S8 n=1 Tax=Novosphingobium sediminis TaxID=707214 RepID=A0A512APE6_9SPHN|nr:S8 family peptidase [Novosphingobium sediminis]GEO01576.1 peptidase S8 [Novosphingobium sediminis]
MAEEGNAESGDFRDKLRRQSAHWLVLPELFEHFEDYAQDGRVRVIAELNIMFKGGLEAARAAALAVLAAANIDSKRLRQARQTPSKLNLFLSLTLAELRTLDQLKRGRRPDPFPIYKVWADQKLKPFAGKPLRTIKADACLATFNAHGRDIVVAVADSGIDGRHAHFVQYKNLENLPDGLRHCDFSKDGKSHGRSALRDEYGHGTHVAGIIAGSYMAQGEGAVTILRQEHIEDSEHLGDEGETQTIAEHNKSPIELRGVAPEAKLLSLKVLDADGSGYASNLIAALEYVFDLNDSGRKTKVHCLNLSLGYPFEAAWYAAGQSPVCVAVTRLVRSGVVVVAAAGNDGSIMLQPEGAGRAKRIGLAQSINDPGNAEAAITVGSTHGESPHLYGVSYFSSRGPTADGRMKPDLLAPGERILSCSPRSAVERQVRTAPGTRITAESICYREESGTSMAAPHVAGAVAAFLSVQNEFIGRPEEVKKVFMDTCTDLGRTREFQGAGLIDMMRAIQSV